jgi:hypothetical protein
VQHAEKREHWQVAFSRARSGAGFSERFLGFGGYDDHREID